MWLVKRLDDRGRGWYVFAAGFPTYDDAALFVQAYQLDTGVTFSSVIEPMPK